MGSGTPCRAAVVQTVMSVSMAVAAMQANMGSGMPCRAAVVRTVMSVSVTVAAMRANMGFMSMFNTFFLLHMFISFKIRHSYNHIYGT
jgi:hypothetical protein